MNHKPFPTIKTERFILRQLNPDDAEALYSIRSNAEVNRYIDRAPPSTLEDVYHFINTINEKIANSLCMYWAIQYQDNNELIGTTCLFNFSDPPDSAEIGYELSPDHQGKGVMREIIPFVIHYAFTNRGVTLLDAIIHPQNLASIKLVNQFDFKQAESHVEGFSRYSLIK